MFISINWDAKDHLRVTNRIEGPMQFKYRPIHLNKQNENAAVQVLELNFKNQPNENKTLSSISVIHSE